MKPSIRRVVTVVALTLICGFAIVWRARSLSSAARRSLGIPGPSLFEAGEPLDCDEAAYGYIGRRVARGAALYRDVSENKPPLGYWLYAAAVRIGGATETTIRLLPIPLVLSTLVLLFTIAARLSGVWSGVFAAIAYALLSADPYLFGNGAHLEHAMNLFAVAALAFASAALASDRHVRYWAAAGVCVGLASLVKQVAVSHLIELSIAAAIVSRNRTRPRTRLRSPLALLVGFSIPWLIAVGVLIGQGAARDAFEDVVRLGAAIATDVPPPPHAPSSAIRWLVGNSDPRDGSLPWPFGSTDYLHWWGAGSWPLWLAAVVAIPRLVVVRADPARPLIVAWTVSSAIEVVAPGLYWQHYYLLLAPGAALLAAIAWSDAIQGVRNEKATKARRLVSAALLVLYSAALAGESAIQSREYQGRSNVELARLKGGAQWVAQRALGRELKRRVQGWNNPSMFVWGYQSPLIFYSGLDGPARDFFANEWLRRSANDGRARDRGRLDRIMSDLRARPPDLIVAGYPPFPALKSFLNERYLPTALTRADRDGAGRIWVKRDRFSRFSYQGPRRPKPTDRD